MAKARGLARVIDYSECYDHWMQSPRPAVWPFPLWSAAATAFLLRPSHALAREVADELAQFKGGAPDAAIHIRHCDKGVEAMLHPVPAYLELLPDSLPHPAQVLLVTDDHDIYREPHHLESNGAADRFVFHRDASAEALRECTWCGEMPGNAGTSECFMRHQARALLDLHTMARAPIAALTFSSNFAHLLIELQLFTHSFCASVVSVDNYVFALGTGRAFLAADNTSASADGDAGASTGAVSVRRQVTVVRTKDEGRVATERVLPPQVTRDWFSSRLAARTHPLSVPCRVVSFTPTPITPHDSQPSAFLCWQLMHHWRGSLGSPSMQRNSSTHGQTPSAATARLPLRALNPNRPLRAQYLEHSRPWWRRKMTRS